MVGLSCVHAAMASKQTHAVAAIARETCGLEECIEEPKNHSRIAAQESIRDRAEGGGRSKESTRPNEDEGNWLEPT